jgi:3-oxocholest-4-en-26-oyl-CoA dehydrogenase beta subunit
MDFTFSPEQNELTALVRQIATGLVSQQRLKQVETQPVHFDRELWSALARAGVLGAALPDAVGGGGLDFVEQCGVLVELGRAVAPVPYLVNTMAAAAIGYFGTDEQRTRWAAPAAAGELVLTVALTEDLVDSPEDPTTLAERDGDGWRISGAKAVVPFAGVAAAFLVPARTANGVKLFLVLPGDEGVGVQGQQVVDGDQEGALDLRGVRLPGDRLVPGADVVHWLHARTTVGYCALQLGVLERALEMTAAYAREREQFGRPIGSFQAVAQRLADAYIDVQGVRLTMWEAAWRIANALPGSGEIATAKFWAADAGHRVAHTAVHVHGGTGIDTDAPLHRYFVAAKRNEFALGGATEQLRRLGRMLADSPA